MDLGALVNVLDAFHAGDPDAAAAQVDAALGGPGPRRRALAGAAIAAAAMAYLGFKLARWPIRAVHKLYVSARASPALVLKAAGSDRPANFVVACGRFLKSKSARLSEKQFVAVIDALSANPAIRKLDHDQYADVMSLVWRLSCRMPPKTNLYPVAWAVHDDAAAAGFPRAAELADRRKFRRKTRRRSARK